MPGFTLRDLLRKGLDAYEAKYERRDEEFANLVNRNVEALSNRRTLLIYVSILVTINALVWLSVLLFPLDIADAWATVSDLDDKLAFTLVAIIFGVGMWLTYALFRLKFPDLENPEFEKEVLASFHYSQHSTRRWRIWLTSVIGGIVNVLALFVAEIFLAGGL